jgi:preprotein translocase subunit SecG
MLKAITIFHILLTVTLIGLVLIQRGKGADVGAAFGSGASNTMFGSQGSASFLTRTTALVAALFFVTSLSLAYISGQRVERKSVTELQQSAPAAAAETKAKAPEAPAKQADVPAVPADKPELPATGGEKGK